MNNLTMEEFKLCMDVLIEWIFWGLVHLGVLIGILTIAYVALFVWTNRKQIRKKLRKISA